MNRVAWFVAVTLFLPPQFLLGDDKATDSERLQGHWKLTEADDSDGVSKKRGFAKHVLVVKGDKMVIEPEQGEKDEARPFKLAPEKDPKRIDFQSRGKGKDGQERVGIYVLDGDTLKICFSSVVPVDESRRPTDFTTKPDSGRVLLVYKRVKD